VLDQWQTVHVCVMSSVQLVVTVIRAVDDKNVAVDLFVIRRVQCG